MLRVSKAWTEGVGDSVIPCRISWTEVLCRLGLLVICHICLSNVPKSMVKEADYWVKSLVKLYLINIILFSVLRTYHRAFQFLLFVESGFCPLSLCVIRCQAPGTLIGDLRVLLGHHWYLIVRAFVVGRSLRVPWLNDSPRITACFWRGFPPSSV